MFSFFKKKAPPAPPAATPGPADAPPAPIAAPVVAPVAVPQAPAPKKEHVPGWLTLRGARGHNLKNVDVSFPLGRVVAVTGVSGSGKSTLVQDTLFPRLMYELFGTRTVWEPHDHVEGVQQFDKVIDIDQSPIGRTPRSNPATYTGTFDMIRALFAMTPDSKMRGYTQGRFSFNVKGGRCEACKGDGIIKIEMHFLPDVYVPCEVCKGKRYNRETLEVKYKGKSISDVLEMTIEEAVDFFRPIPKIFRKLETLLEKARASIQDTETKLTELGLELEGNAEGTTKALADREAEREALLAQRAEAQKALPPTLFRRYETIRQRRPKAIAQTTDGTCNGCHISLPPMLFQQMMRREQFEQCPQCRRILYFVPRGELSSSGSSPEPEADGAT